LVLGRLHDERSSTHNKNIRNIIIKSVTYIFKEEAAMRKSARSTLAIAGTLALVMGSFSVAPGIASAASAEDEGKKISFHKKKGNCLACHKIAGGKAAGNIGPALVNMKARYPDKKILRKQIWDATANNPNSIMPPFGRHKILNEKEIDKVVKFIYTL
jgi:sulfur-oxidizing protein SoxX